MSVGLLGQLPGSSVKRKGWPWTEETDPMLFESLGRLPKLSVVTPSYNQRDFLEETLRSIILQNYPNLELIVIDGGSSDGSVELLEEYDPWIDYWVSESDNGQSHALNKGFQRATGDWAGWQNSDDIYYPNAFVEAMRVYQQNPDADILFSNATTIDAQSQITHRLLYAPFAFGEMKYSGWAITNQACFFSRDVIDNFPVNEDLSYAMDADLYWRIARAGKKFVHTKQYWGGFRYHDQTKTVNIDRDVGWEEYQKLRSSYNITMTDQLWSEQYRLWKVYYKIRKGLYYLPEILSRKLR